MAQPTKLVNRTIKSKQTNTKKITRLNGVQYPKLAALQILFYSVSWFIGPSLLRASTDLRFTSMNLDFWMKKAVNNIYFLLTSSSTVQGREWTIPDLPVSVLITAVRCRAPSLMVKVGSNAQQWPRHKEMNKPHTQQGYLHRETMNFLKSHGQFSVTRAFI